MHKWNGIGNLIGAEDRNTSYWFSEGFTEYYSNIMLSRTGLIDKNTLYKKIEKHLGMYLFYNWSGAFKDSILDSGKRKGFNRPGVYSGGWSVAFCVDVLIRSKTDNKRSLDDLMKRMYREFGMTGRKYKIDDIVRISGEIAGENLKPFFDEFVVGTKTLPVAGMLDRAGFEAGLKGYSGEVYIWEKTSPSRLESAILKSLRGGLNSR